MKTKEQIIEDLIFIAGFFVANNKIDYAQILKEIINTLKASKLERKKE